MQTMTLASGDTDVAELVGRRHPASPGKRDLHYGTCCTQARRQENPDAATVFTGHFLGVREDLGARASPCSAASGFAARHRRPGMAAEVRQDTRNRRGLTVAGSPGKPLPRRVSRGAGYLFWRAPGAALERRHDGGAAVPSGDLTLMSLDADAHVMTRLSDPPHTDKSVIFHPR